MLFKNYYYYAKDINLVTPLKSAKHTKANSEGKKAIRPNIKKISRDNFSELNSISGLLEKLFPDIKKISSK